ncbi:hypothetical protein MMC25_001803 [Agyrium rufum]|nr:hypothetical protein [Agyrium rufum]
MGFLRLHIADALATLLWNYDPETLRAFLNMDHKEFKFACKEKDTFFFSFFFHRKTTFVRYVTSIAVMSNGDYKNWIRKDGRWIPEWGLLNGMPLVPMDDVRHEQREKTAAEFGKTFAGSLILSKRWAANEDATITLTYS